MYVERYRLRYVAVPYTYTFLTGYLLIVFWRIDCVENHACGTKHASEQELASKTREKEE